MLLYHTGFQEIRDPDLHYGRKNADFGQGFYLTSNLAFAQRWTKERKNQPAVLNTYELDLTDLAVHRFLRDTGWYDYIFNNRAGKPDPLAADVVIGPIANDTLYDTLGILTSGFLKKENALQLLTIGPEFEQIAIRPKKQKNTCSGKQPASSGVKRSALTGKRWKKSRRNISLLLQKKWNLFSKDMLKDTPFFERVFLFYILIPFIPLSDSQCVAAVVVFVFRMAFNPVIMHFVLGDQQKQPLPKVRIKSRFFIAFDPSFFLPGNSPILFQSIYHIFGVRIQIDLTGFFQAFQCGNNSGQFHAVVCRLLFSAGDFLFFSFIAQDGSPAAGTRIPAAGTVRIDGNLFFIQHREAVPQKKALPHLRCRKNVLSFRYRSPSHRRQVSSRGRPVWHGLFLRSRKQLHG